MLLFASAYRQLQPAERVFVDGCVREMEDAAHRSGHRISSALNRPIPPAIVERSRGMLERPMVTAAITERITELAARQELTVERMVNEMMALAFSSIGNYMHVNGDGEPEFDLSRCTPEQLAAIKSIDVEEIGDGLTRPLKRKFKLTLHDKISGMKMLGEFMGILQPDNPHWKAELARAAAPMLPDGATAQQAGDAYAAMIDGQ